MTTHIKFCVNNLDKDVCRIFNTYKKNYNPSNIYLKTNRNFNALGLHTNKENGIYFLRQVEKSYVEKKFDEYIEYVNVNTYNYYIMNHFVSKIVDEDCEDDDCYCVNCSEKFNRSGLNWSRNKENKKLISDLGYIMGYIPNDIREIICAYIKWDVQINVYILDYYKSCSNSALKNYFQYYIIKQKYSTYTGSSLLPRWTLNISIDKSFDVLGADNFHEKILRNFIGLYNKDQNTLRSVDLLYNEIIGMGRNDFVSYTKNLTNLTEDCVTKSVYCELYTVRYFYKKHCESYRELIFSQINGIFEHSFCAETWKYLFPKIMGIIRLLKNDKRYYLLFKKSISGGLIILVLSETMIYDVIDELDFICNKFTD